MLTFVVIILYVCVVVFVPVCIFRSLHQLYSILVSFCATEVAWFEPFQAVLGEGAGAAAAAAASAASDQADAFYQLVLQNRDKWNPSLKEWCPICTASQETIA